MLTSPLYRKQGNSDNFMANSNLPVPQPEQESPLWGRNFKLVVASVIVVLLALLVWQFASLIRLVVIAAMLAFILNPLVVLIDERTPLKRGSIILLVYIGIAVAIIWALVALGFAAYAQLDNLLLQLPDYVNNISQSIETFITSSRPLFSIGDFSLIPSQLPWADIQDRFLNMLSPLTSGGATFLGDFATATLGWLGNLLFVFMISIYIANEFPKLGEYVANFATDPGYRHDAERLVRDFGRIWSAYLRGQVILGLVIFVVVWLGLLLLGVENALALGLVAGVLEFVPNLGPIISAIVAVVAAFFQSQNYLGLGPWELAAAVIILMLVVQQLENNLLVPRIVGQALDLHPLVVLVGVFMGASLAGILGAVLAAPVIASLKLLGSYTWRKMLDLPPFPKPEPEPPPRGGLMDSLRNMLSSGTQGRKGKDGR